MKPIVNLLEDCEMSPAAVGDCAHELRGVLPDLREPYLRIKAALQSFCARTYYDECALGVITLIVYRQLHIPKYIMVSACIAAAVYNGIMTKGGTEGA